MWWAIIQKETQLNEQQISLSFKLVDDYQNIFFKKQQQVIRVIVESVLKKNNKNNNKVLNLKSRPVFFLSSCNIYPPVFFGNKTEREKLAKRIPQS